MNEATYRWEVAPMPRDERSPWVLVVAVLAVTALCVDGRGQDMRRRKKLIATGWDQPTSRELPGILRDVESRPFDGVVVPVVGQRGDGKPASLGWAFLNEKWSRAWFEPEIDRLKGCKFQRLTDNFLIVHANPGSVDWFDDAGWESVAEHWRIAAWVAKKSGFKGIVFDPEAYSPPHAQFNYAAQPDRAKHGFNEYYAKARQRGRRIMEAAAAEYPEITILCFFMNSVNATGVGHADPRPALAGSPYGLLPAMIDGWLDAAPPAATFVDGCESAYLFNSRQQYLEAANLMRGPCQELVSPENRAKHRAQVQASFGIYLDAYWNPKNSPAGAWYVDGLGGPRVERLRANLQSALDAADEYVWVYGERFRWWPTANGGVRKESWPEALPGCDHILAFVRDPLDYARRALNKLKSQGKAVDLARNGDFASDTAASLDGPAERHRENGPPAGWHTWQEDASHGTFSWDRATNGPSGGQGSARAANVRGGCFIQAYRAKPGERYAVGAICRTSGNGDAKIRVRWQTPDGRWTAEPQDRLIFAEGPGGAGEGGWSKLFGVVEVPEIAGRLVILLGVAGQTSAHDVAWFDNVELYRLP